jgi:hypothetical protein
MDGLIDLTSSRFFQADATRSEVTVAVAVEMGGLQPPPVLLRLWCLRSDPRLSSALSCHLMYQSYVIDWLSRDLQIRTTGIGRMFSIPGEEVGEATRLTNLLYGKGSGD